MSLNIHTSRVVQAEPCFSMRQAWKLVQFQGTFRSFIQWLKDEKLLMVDLEPYSKHLRRGLFHYTLVFIRATSKVVTVTRVTIKGLHFIEQRLKHQNKNIQSIP